RMDVARLEETLEELTADQRLVLACQVALDMQAAEFCRRFGWSPEKFRKVAQRARARLLGLQDEYARGERGRRLDPDLIALAARVADELQRHRATRHLSNCESCRRRMRELAQTERALVALLPAPLVAGLGGLLARPGGAHLQGGAGLAG